MGPNKCFGLVCGIMLTMLFVFCEFVRIVFDLSSIDVGKVTEVSVSSGVDGGGRGRRVKFVAEDPNKVDVLGNVHDSMNKIIKYCDGKDVPPIYKYSQLPTDIKYTSNQQLTIGCHAGQRKLLLSEIEFLNNFCGDDIDLVVYAGSAPNNKFHLLRKMFPKKKFLLVDPNYHQFTSEMVYVYQDPRVIDPVNVKEIKMNLKRKSGKFGARQHAQVEQLTKIRVRGVGGVFDMTRVGQPDHDAKMLDIMRNFEDDVGEVGYRKLIEDMVVGNDYVYVIHGYLAAKLSTMIKESRELAEVKLGRSLPMCFISDIRSSFFNVVSDLDYIWNDALQVIFLNCLKPKYSMLKFHPPYMSFDGESYVNELASGSTKQEVYGFIRQDLEEAKKYGFDPLPGYLSRSRDYRYFANTTIYLQAWAPASSSESRLIVSDKDIDSPMVVYSSVEWDDRFMANKKMRGYSFHGLFYNKLKQDSQKYYDGCFDCMLEIMILTNYLAKFRGVDMDADAIAKVLDDPEMRKRLYELRRDVDEAAIYSPYDKCFAHGQLTQVPRGLRFFAIDVTNNTDKMDVLSVRKIGGRFVTKLVCTVSSKEYKFKDGVKVLLIADNLRVPADEAGDNLRKMGRRFVKGFNVFNKLKNVDV